MYDDDYINSFKNIFKKEYIAIYTDSKTKLRILNISEKEKRSVSSLCDIIIRDYIDKNYKKIMEGKKNVQECNCK